MGLGWRHEADNTSSNWHASRNAPCVAVRVLCLAVRQATVALARSVRRTVVHCYKRRGFASLLASRAGSPHHLNSLL